MFPFSFIVNTLIVLIPVLLSVAFVTLFERKILALVQLRLGPNKIVVSGVVQPFSDAVKLMRSAMMMGFFPHRMLFIAAPMVMLSVSLALWYLLPSVYFSGKISMSILTLLCLFSIGVYPLLLSGWSSNNKYGMIGAVRAVAQTISYEVSLAIVLMNFMSIFLSFHLMETLTWKLGLFWLTPFLAYIWLMLCVAETNRTPFDFSEGESELVSGFNIEYASVGFILIFLSEYSAILMFSSVSVGLLFSLFPFSVVGSVMIITLSGVWMVLRSSFPRYKYDYLMFMAWKIYLPITLFFLVLLCSAVLY